MLHSITRKTRRPFFLNVSLMLILCSPALWAQTNEWTRFRGVQGKGVDTRWKAPVTWNSSDFQWEITLPGTGSSSPVVWGNRIFVTGADSEQNTGYVIAVDESNGRILWKKEFELSELTMHEDNDLASHSPAVDGSNVYCIWYSREKTMLATLSHDGALQWQSAFSGIETRFGGGSSLVLTENNVVFTREQESEHSSLNSSWIAVNKLTGRIAWELERETCTRNSFSTPILVKNDQQEAQLIFTSEAHGFTGVDPQTGMVLWERKDLLKHRVVSSPVYSDGLIIGCRKGEGVVLEADLNRNRIADTPRYTLPPNLSPYVPTPIVAGDLLFLYMDNGTVACVRFATGELLWKERPAGAIYGSPVCVNGFLYAITKAGKVVVIRADSTYQLLGINDLGDESFSTPVMCESGMILRTFTSLMLLGN